MKTKNFLKTLMALLFTVCCQVLLVHREILALFDLKGKVKQCTWVNHKAGCLQKGFSKTADKEVIAFFFSSWALPGNGTIFCLQRKVEVATLFTMK